MSFFDIIPEAATGGVQKGTPTKVFYPGKSVNDCFCISFLDFIKIFFYGSCTLKLFFKFFIYLNLTKLCAVSL